MKKKFLCLYFCDRLRFHFSDLLLVRLYTEGLFGLAAGPGDPGPEMGLEVARSSGLGEEAAARSPNVKGRVSNPPLGEDIS